MTFPCDNDRWHGDEPEIEARREIGRQEREDYEANHTPTWYELYGEDRRFDAYSAYLDRLEARCEE